MPPNIDVTAHDPPTDTPSKGKRIMRYSLHILHLTIALLLFCIVIFHLIGVSLFILYLLPLIIHVIIIEICFLCHRRPPKSLTQGILAPESLRRRAFAYQFSGVFAMSSKGYGPLSTVALVMAIIVWVLGILLFGLGIISHEYGFEDWVEEPEPEGTIRLSDAESSIGGSPITPRSPA